MKSNEEEFIPKDVNQAVAYLDYMLPDEDRTGFANMDEEEAVTSSHLGTGMWIRNNWGLWDKEKNDLVLYFNSLGIYEPDDMSAIIMRSLHRRLNKKDIDMDSQVL